MCKKLIYFCLVLTFALASTSYGLGTGQPMCPTDPNIVIGDFEQTMDGWGPSWEGTPTFGYSNTTGVTLHEWSLQVGPSQASGFKWSMLRDGVIDFDAWPTLHLDVTWVASEWVDDGNQTIWVNLELVAVNSQAGWFQVQADDPVNPDWPGSWDPYNWGAVHTRHLSWCIWDLEMAKVTDWMQVLLATNYGGDIVTAGNYYIDNIRLTPEPATIALLGLGGLAMLRRRRR